MKFVYNTMILICVLLLCVFEFVCIYDCCTRVTGMGNERGVVKH